MKEAREIAEKLTQRLRNAWDPERRVEVDFTGERYWTLVVEFETAGLAEFEKMMQGEGMSEADTKEFERIITEYARVSSEVRRRT